VAPDSACGREGLAAGPPRGGQRGVYAILGAAFIVGTALLFGLGARIKPCSPRPVRLWVLGAFGFLMVANALRR
jgi:hypothetical protein